MASKSNDKFWRVNRKPNEVNIDIRQFQHDFDPKQLIYEGLIHSTLIQELNKNMNPSFITNSIISFVGLNRHWI